MLNTLAAIGPQEGLLVIVVLLVLFGGAKIPEIMRGVGKGVGELKGGIDEAKRTINDAKP